MEGMYQGMQHATSIASANCNIAQYFDCESAIKHVNGNVYHPKQTMAPEADIVMAYHHALKHINQTVNLRHVKGHQDKGAKYEDIDYQTQCNIDCDEMAGDTMKQHHNQSHSHLKLNQKQCCRLMANGLLGTLKNKLNTHKPPAPWKNILKSD